MLVVMGFPPNEAAHIQRLLATIETVRSNPRAASTIGEARDAQRVATEFLDAHASGGLPRESVLATLLSACQRDGLSVDDVVSLAVHIAAVGTGPTSGAIANAILALAEHADVLSALHEHPQWMRSARHELLRYDSPTHIVPRFAAVDTVLAGRRVHRSDSVFVMAGAANRDPQCSQRRTFSTSPATRGGKWASDRASTSVSEGPWRSRSSTRRWAPSWAGSAESRH